MFGGGIGSWNGYGYYSHSMEIAILEYEESKYERNRYSGGIDVKFIKTHFFLLKNLVGGHWHPPTARPTKPPLWPQWGPPPWPMGGPANP